MSWTGIGAGAADGLETLLTRQRADELLARQQAALQETVRSNQAQEGLGTRRIQAEETNAAANREMAAAARAQTAANQANQDAGRQRDDARATLAIVPAGTQISQEDYDRFTKQQAAVPGMFDPVRGPQDDGAVEAPVTGYTFKGTASEQAAANALKQREQAATDADAARQRGLDQAAAREDRLRSYGAPTINIFDPNSPTRTTVVSRDQLPKGGAPGPEPPGQRAQVTSNASSVDQLDNLKALHDKVTNRTGPVSGRMNEIGKVVPLVKTSPEWAEFSAASAAVQNATIKAITGAALSEKEAQRIMGQIPKVTDKPEVWDANYRQSVRNLQTLERIIAERGGQNGAPAAGAAPKRTTQSGRFTVEEY